MYKHKLSTSVSTSIILNTATEGETIEKKVARITQNNEPITDGAPITYTDRVDGVRPEFNVRTDRFELATEAMDKITKDKLAAREKRHMKVPKVEVEEQKSLPALGEQNPVL